MNETVIAKYFLYFMIYSFMGWIMEVIVTYKEQKKFVNRGFLIGPYCPIYGWGILIIIILLGKPHSDIFGIFLKSMVIAGILEYFTSYFMEKVYKFRWWDYSERKFNINGRVCLENLIPFGLLGLIFFNYIHPFISTQIDKISNNILIILAIILFIVYLLDNIISNKLLYKISKKVTKNAKDNTIEIKKQFVNWFQEQSKLYQRIAKAFPDFRSKIDINKTKRWLLKK